MFNSLSVYLIYRTDIKYQHQQRGITGYTGEKKPFSSIQQYIIIKICKLVFSWQTSIATIIDRGYGVTENMNHGQK